MLESFFQEPRVDIMKLQKWFHLILLCLWLLLGASRPGLAQAGKSPAAEPKTNTSPESLRINVELVFSVHDKKGKLATNLDKTDFKVYENNIPQTITNFANETNLPLAIALLIDASSSIRDKLQFEQEASMDFFFATLRRQIDRGVLVSFDTTLEVLQDFTDDPDLMAKALKKLRPGGGTRMFDAIFFACQEKLQKAQAPRKALVLISDGEDNASTHSLDDVIEIAHRTETAIYTISTNSAGFFGMSAPKNDELLKKLADETGGRALFPMKALDLGRSFQEISQELRHQYSLAYRSTDIAKNGAFRPIRIECTVKGLKVNARKGYFAPKE
jgi:Ca-activated chloride channel homolog